MFENYTGMSGAHIQVRRIQNKMAEVWEGWSKKNLLDKPAEALKLLRERRIEDDLLNLHSIAADAHGNFLETAAAKATTAYLQKCLELVRPLVDTLINTKSNRLSNNQLFGETKNQQVSLFAKQGNAIKEMEEMMMPFNSVIEMLYKIATGGAISGPLDLDHWINSCAAWLKDYVTRGDSQREVIIELLDKVLLKRAMLESNACSAIWQEKTATLRGAEREQLGGRLFKTCKTSLDVCTFAQNIYNKCKDFNGSSRLYLASGTANIIRSKLEQSKSRAEQSKSKSRGGDPTKFIACFCHTITYPLSLLPAVSLCVTLLLAVSLSYPPIYAHAHSLIFSYPPSHSVVRRVAQDRTNKTRKPEPIGSMMLAGTSKVGHGKKRTHTAQCLSAP